MHMIVTRYQNKTLYNVLFFKVFFDTYFTDFVEDFIIYTEVNQKLKLHYAQLRGNNMCKIERISVYFVASMFRLILNSDSTKPKHKNENRKIDFDEFYLQ